MSELFRNVLTASFHGSIVITAVILLRLALKKTPKKFICLLWLLAGVRLLMPFEIQSNLSLQPETPVAEVQWQGHSFMEDAPVRDAVNEIEANPSREDTPVLSHTEPQQTQAPAVIAEAQPVQTAPAEPRKEPFDWMALIPYAWVLVASGFGIYTLVCYLHLKRQVREATKIPGGWESEHIDTAFILGFIRPKIYIPMGMSQMVRKYILAHERTHLEKGDHWFKMIGFLALAIHWFNPLVWVAYSLLCKDIEMACDERVVQFMELEERKEYSAALLSCSTNRAHFAACPVAFGEVSVKERVLSVLNYKKPSFWISLLGVVAIIVVAVCLVTNPTKAPEDVPAGETTSAEETIETTAPVTYADPLERIEEALQARLAQDSYYFDVIASMEEGSVTWQTHYLKSGENIMWRVTDTDWLTTGHMVLDGQFYTYTDQKWITCEPVENQLEDWLSWFSWEGMEIGGITESTVTNEFGSYQEVKFTAYEDTEDSAAHSQKMSFTFDVEGNLTGGYIENADTSLGDRLSFDFRTDYMGESIEGQFAATAEIAMTPEEYEAEKMEVPSNHTEYDRDFGLGSGSMRWYFFNEAASFRLEGENPTATGITLLHCEAGGDVPEVTAEEGYWLEELVDGKWVLLDGAGSRNKETVKISWEGQERYSLDWTDSYGALDAGYYRVGRYYTAQLDGETETIVAYAKFRVYNPNADKLLTKCRNAYNALLDSDSYHIYSFDWMIEYNYDYYLSHEVMKHGGDFLSVTRYPLREDTSKMWNVNSALWRDGKYYGITWSGEPMASDVAEWWVGVDGYLDSTNFNIWIFRFEWYDSQVEDVLEEGNTIRIIQTYDATNKYECSELTFTFDEKGNLKGMVKAYLPTRNCAEKDKVIGIEMVVFDTSAGEIGGSIDSVDVSKSMAFSYEEDVKNNPDAQNVGFKNTTASTVKTPMDAIALADKECTLPVRSGFNKGYFQSMAYYDDAAKIWKVVLYWWQDDVSQTVYMNDQGITQMIVTVE